jgi:hypothetical protein
MEKWEFLTLPGLELIIFLLVKGDTQWVEVVGYAKGCREDLGAGRVLMGLKNFVKLNLLIFRQDCMQVQRSWKNNRVSWILPRNSCSNIFQSCEKERGVNMVNFNIRAFPPPRSLSHLPRWQTFRNILYLLTGTCWKEPYPIWLIRIYALSSIYSIMKFVFWVHLSCELMHT